MSIFQCDFSCYKTWTQAQAMHMGDNSQAYDGSLLQLCQSDTKMTSHIGHFRTIANNLKDIFLITLGVRDMQDYFDRVLIVMSLIQYDLN